MASNSSRIRNCVVKFHSTRLCMLMSAGLITGLGACAMPTGTAAPVEFIGLDDSDVPQSASLRQFRECRKDALAFDKAASDFADEGKYLASARRATQCLKALPAKAANTAAREALQLHALTVQNYLIGGDPKAAKNAYKAMVKQFPNQDLVFKDASSVKETFAYILTIRSGKESDNYRQANINAALKVELRRLEYHRKQ